MKRILTALMSLLSLSFILPTVTFASGQDITTIPALTVSWQL